MRGWMSIEKYAFARRSISDNNAKSSRSPPIDLMSRITTIPVARFETQVTLHTVALSKILGSLILVSLTCPLERRPRPIRCTD